MAPGDEVLTRMDLEGVGQDITNHNFDRVYAETAALYGLDLPIFFFSVQANFIPDTIQQIIPQRKRVLILNLLQETKDWEGVEHMLRQLNDLTSFYKGEDKSVYLEFLKLEQELHLSKIQARVAKMENEFGNELLATAAFKKFKSTLAELGKEGSFVYPKFVWHGSKNQFSYWLGQVFNPERNRSLLDGQPAIGKISRGLKWTFSMSFIAWVIAGCFSLVMALLMSYYNDTFIERFFSALWYMLFAVPTFWFASLMVAFFTTADYGAWTDVFPSIGLKPSFVKQSFWQEFLLNTKQLILPIFCMVILSVSFLIIQLKKDIVKTEFEPFVLFAKSKGMSKFQLLMKHLLPNGLVPFITIMTGAIPGLFAGSAIIEVIFNIPGLGYLTLESVKNGDWPVVFSTIVLISIVTIFGYIIGDLLLFKFYPKSRSSLLAKDNM